MKLQRQGQNQCWVTAVCMATGHDREAVVEATMERFADQGETWRDLWSYNDDSYLDVAAFVVEATGAPASLVDDLVRANHEVRGIFRPNGAEGREEIEVPRQGRGILIIAQRDLRGHAVAFEDGVVYDPIYHRPMTPDEFNHVRRGWRLVTTSFVVPPPPTD